LDASRTDEVPRSAACNAWDHFPAAMNSCGSACACSSDPAGCPSS
jgi:hypothetical protein